MNYLSSLVDKYPKTDKKVLGYTLFYEDVFSTIRNDVKKILEIGIANGDSLRVWRDYFPNATVYGWDIDSKTLFTEDRIVTLKVNHDDKVEVTEALNSIGEDIDIIIDDGSHLMESQQQLLDWCFTYVKSKGFYVIEDLHTSTVPGLYGANRSLSNTTYKMIVEFLAYNRIESEYLSKHSASYLQSTIEYAMIYSNTENKVHPWNSYILAMLRKK